jgi:hypothetical protein
MPIALQITFIHAMPSAVLEADIRERVDALALIFARITSCRVFVEAPPRHHRQGGVHQVRIELRVPGEQMVVGRAPDRDTTHADAHLAVRDAFRALHRQLGDYVQRRRQAVSVGGVKESVS